METNKQAVNNSSITDIEITGKKFCINHIVSIYVLWKLAYALCWLCLLEKLTISVSTHAFELPFLFNSDAGSMVPFNLEDNNDKKVMDLMGALWTNFAKFGYINNFCPLIANL